MKDHGLSQLVGFSSSRYSTHESPAVSGPDIQMTKSVVWYRLFRGNGSVLQPWQDRLDDYRQDQ
ncbi:hypothetical protein [Paenibacillus sp. GCM10028914]|uniref:hypothetical protein n=1 Tax=Paenibacillus sp. GCM10028914 TaxID=3273416 RepID=UPI003605CDE0